jgi:flagellar biosynthesis/type III secretory pathway M-ring protein FliF/YscJ
LCAYNTGKSLEISPPIGKELEMAIINPVLVVLILAVIVFMWIPACRRRQRMLRQAQAKEAEERKVLMEQFFHDLDRLMQRRIDPKTKVFYEGIEGTLAYQLEEKNGAKEKDEDETETEEKSKVFCYSLEFIPTGTPSHATIFSIIWDQKNDTLSFNHGFVYESREVDKDSLERLLRKIVRESPSNRL